MRSLIQPALFAIARMGLFLSVVAWVVGQRLDYDEFGVDFAVVNCRLSSGNWGFFVTKSWAKPFTGGITHLTPVRQRAWPAFRFTTNRGEALAAFRMRHWFVVTAFAFVNILLHFIYRRRPESQPCEN